MTTITSTPTHKQRSIFLFILVLFILTILTAAFVRPFVQPSQETLTITTSNLNGFEQPLSAAAALTLDKPILYVFVPQEGCQQRYCRTTELIAGDIYAEYGDAFSIVHVPVHTIPTAESAEAPDHVHAEWNVYPVPPFRELLPAAEETAAGWGLKTVQVRLADTQGKLLYAGGEWFDIAELAQFTRE